MSDPPGAPVLIASNRGPVTFDPGEQGELVARRGAGGLVTALTGALQRTGGTWIAAALSDGDREMASRSPDTPIEVESDGETMRLRFLTIDPDRFDGYYNRVSNGILWFVHHYLWDTVRSPSFDGEDDRDWNSYVEVNRAFATALAEEGRRQERNPLYLIQDYHLALVPRFLREIQPDALIAHFSHTPFAGPTYLRVLPDRIRNTLMRGLLGADVLGFHSEDWAANFLMSSRYVPGTRVDLGRSRVVADGREVLVRVHPISVDAGPMRELSGSDEVKDLRRKLNQYRGNARLILRVDRLELTKNIRRGFLAYEQFLRAYPNWRERVKFLSLLSPSRQDLAEYRTYTEECLREAERINREFGTPGWIPIEVRVKDDYLGAIAAYGIYDVLFVNPVWDGMNLVAMEGPIINRRQGALVLSKNAGAHSRLGRYALPVNPFDIREMAEALNAALIMPKQERVRRARGLSRLVLANPPARWVGRQLEDLERARRRRGRRPGGAPQAPS